MKKLEVYDRDGKVVLDSDMGNFILPPDQAIDLANALLHAAEVCGVKVVVQSTSPRIITDFQRNKLIVRCALILRSLIRQNRSSEAIAHQVVDTILGAIL